MGYAGSLINSDDFPLPFTILVWSGSLVVFYLKKTPSNCICSQLDPHVYRPRRLEPILPRFGPFCRDISIAHSSVIQLTSVLPSWTALQQTLSRALVRRC
ncbi:hypothetical protein OBBRIDRAFT_288924 [Obba rivulosa]|uniref:Uncharacterized protein n=1 Tax=Obba rivulosa TaxID=1052685 RepID=A0A8E2ALT8_9APHY|nr:hypothetical protein OBBRIDRAFT_288924 [Obba rivulosa]